VPIGKNRTIISVMELSEIKAEGLLKHSLVEKMKLMDKVNFKCSRES
jgi:hypothetical protein